MLSQILSPSNDPKPSQLVSTLVKSLSAHARHVSLPSGDHVLEKDTAASSCSSVLLGAILGLTWRACSLALEALRAGHKDRKRKKRLDRFPLPAEQISDLLRQQHALSATQCGSTDGLNSA